MKKHEFFPKLFLATGIILMLASRLAAQTVAISMTVLPPYSSYLSDYCHLENRAVITLINTSSAGVQVKLTGSLTNESNGLTVQTNSSYQPSMPITIPAHGTTTITANAGAMNFLDQGNATTNAPDNVRQDIMRSGMLPEGVYRLCINANDYISGAMLSTPYQGCSVFSISLAQPPTITFPLDGGEIPVTQKFPTFSWTPPVGNLAGAAVRYKLVVVEILPGQNPNDAIRVARDFKANNPVLYKPNLISQIYTIQPSDLPFQRDHTYAAQVAATDANNKLVFANGGNSAVITFKFGSTGAGTGVTVKTGTGVVDSVNVVQNNATGVSTVQKCDCKNCVVDTPMRIVSQLSGEVIVTDSIPWYNDKLLFNAPVIHSNCPKGCPERHYSWLKATTHFNHSPLNYVDSMTSERGNLSVLVKDPGYILFEASYQCYCDFKLCKKGIETRKIYFTECNGCCDSIRAKNNGKLRLNFKGGFVQIYDNKMSLHIDPDINEPFEFNFNLEAIFCNLKDDQVFGALQHFIESKMNGGDLKEAYTVSSTGMGKAEGFYTLSFHLTINGKETSVVFSIDAKKCIYDVLVLYNDKVYEYAGPPYLSPADIQAMSSTDPMGDYTTAAYWAAFATMMTQLLKADAYNMDEDYRDALVSCMNKLYVTASIFEHQSKDEQFKKQCKELMDAARDCRDNPDFDKLKNVIDKFIPVFNKINADIDPKK